MFCFNSSYCVAFEEASNQEECESTPVCLLADGLLMWGIEKSECETRFGCSVGSGIGSEEECLQQGICEDPDHISESIEVDSFFSHSVLDLIFFSEIGFNSHIPTNCNCEKWGVYYPTEPI